MVKKIVSLLVVILVAAAGLSFYFTERTLDYVQADLIDKYTGEGHLLKLKNKGVHKKYTVTGIHMEVIEPELSVYLGKMEHHVISLFLREEDSLVIKFPEKLVFSKEYFSNKLKVDSPGEYKMAIVSGNSLLTPLLSTRAKQKLITAKLDISKILPFAKRKPKNIFEVIDGLTIESKDIQQFLDNELLSKQDSRSFKLNWNLDLENNNFSANLSCKTKNYLRTPVFERIGELIWMKSISGNPTTLPVSEQLKSYNVARNTTNIFIPEETLSTRVELKNCKDFKNCEVEFYIDDFNGDSNLYSSKLDDLSVKVNIKNKDVQADVSVADIKFALSEDGYNNLINSTKLALVKDGLSLKLNPTSGYWQMYTVANRDDLAAAELLFAAYYEDLFIPYDWIKNFNVNYKFSIDSRELNKIKANFYGALLNNDNKVINSIDFDLKNTGILTAKIVMLNPYDSSTSVMEYYNKLINAYLSSGGYMKNLQKIKSNFPSVFSRLISGVGDKNDNNATVLNITTQERDIGENKVPIYFLGDTELIDFVMQSSQELSSAFEDAQKPTTTVDSFAKSLSDKNLGLASYIYSLRKFNHKEFDVALKYALKAKDQGFVAADPLVGFLEYLQYVKSKNVVELKKSRQQMKLSSKNNDPYAMLSLSALLSIGEDKNPEDAKFYLNKAKELSDDFYVKQNAASAELLSQLINFNGKSLGKEVPFYLVAVNGYDGAIAIAIDGEYTKSIISREVEAYIIFPFLASEAVDLNKYPDKLRGYAMEQLAMAGIKVKNAPKPVVVPKPTTESEHIPPSASGT